MRFTRRSLLSFALLLALMPALVVSSACDPTKVVVTSLSGFTAAVESAVDNGSFDAKRGVKFVTYADQAIVVAETKPGDWKTTLKAGWGTFKGDLSPAEKTQFALTISAVDLVMASL